MKTTIDLRAKRHRRVAAYERPQVRWSGRRRWRWLAAAHLAGDALALGGALTAATVARFGVGGLTGRYGPLLAGWVVLWWVGLAGVGLYDLHLLENPARELRRIVDGVTIGAALVVMGSFAAGFPLSRGWLVIAWGLSLAAMLAVRRVLRKAIHALRRRGKLRRRALIVGADATARELADAVERAPWEGIEVVGYVAAAGAHGEELRDGDRILGSLARLRELAILHRVNEVLVAPGAAGAGVLNEVVAALDGIAIDLRVAPGLDGFLASRLSIQPLGDRSLVAVERVELRPGARVAKRAIDVVFGSALVIALSPVLLACALAVCASGSGGAFFRQERVGVGGKRFIVWKFRSMVPDAERRRVSLDNGADGLLFKVKDDPRVTGVGRFLRRTSLDELPQLFNVVRGDMSLVGPRPPLPEEVERYDPQVERRLLVKPGITGLWQVSGRSELSFDDYVRYDLLYVQNWSVALDLYIMLRTIPAVLSRRGAY